MATAGSRRMNTVLRVPVGRTVRKVAKAARAEMMTGRVAVTPATSATTVDAIARPTDKVRRPNGNGAATVAAGLWSRTRPRLRPIPARPSDYS